MRTILLDDMETRIEQEGSNQFVYRKDYLYKGDMKEEYSLVLIFSRTARGKELHDLKTPGLLKSDEKVLPLRPVEWGTVVRGQHFVHPARSCPSCEIEAFTPDSPCAA